MTDDFITGMAKTILDKDSLPVIPNDGIEVLLWPGEDRAFGMGLRFTAPPPLGTVVIPLTGSQLIQVHSQLHRLLEMNNTEIQQLLNKLHDGDAA